MFKNLFIIFSLLSTQAFALVDYTDDSESSYKPAARKKAPRNTSTVKRTNRRATRSSGGKKYLELASTYESHTARVGQVDHKVSALKLNGHIETDYDIFVDFNVPWYSGKYKESQVDSSYQIGNAEVLFGVNWLRIGQAEKALSFDLKAGMTLSSSSEFATSRSDKMVSIGTQKRFYDFALGFGYELTMTGSTKDQEERDIGNIQKLEAQIGWLVSHDIRFVVSAASVKVNTSDDVHQALRLEEQIRYGYVAPELILTMAPGVELSMKGLFQTRRPKDHLLTSDLSLWNQEGIYGNALSAGLNFSI